MKKNGAVRVLLSLALTAVIGFLIFYMALPAISLYSVGTYFLIILLCGIYIASYLLIGFKQNSTYYGNKNVVVRFVKMSTGIWPAVALIAISVLVMLVGALSSATIFRAKSYAGIVTVEQAVFEEDMPETTTVTNIALMDTESARIIGNRTLGSLSELVSQYCINEQYTQINYKGAPKKIATLEYDDFFKWMNNRSEGVPGYVMVDPVNSNAVYQKLETPMQYVESGCFGDNLLRKLRFGYPTKLFESIYFEIDDEGKPFYIVACKKPKVGLFGGYDVNEVILFDPCSGDSTLYPVEEVPAWVDIVFNGQLASQKYNWNGNLSGGFWNSMFGNKNCKQTTDDFGYLVRNDDVWYFTGVTSVTADESNIGFLLSNARTGEYKFYPVVGAEEYSAMSAAEGEVQEKGYEASFPSLINIGGQATYIMVLKDSGGLVKLYALVNVENYSIVATGETQAEAMASYKKLLRNNNVGGGTKEEAVQIEVENVRLITIENMPTVYVTAVDGTVYKGYLNMDESLILVRPGDLLEVVPEKTEEDRIFYISEWKFKEK